MNRIKEFIRKIYNQLDWYFRKKEYREFLVTECKAMPTLKGMKTFGQISINRVSIFVADNAVLGYRTMKPLMIRKLDRDDFVVYTEHLNFKIKRTK